MKCCQFKKGIYTRKDSAIVTGIIKYSFFEKNYSPNNTHPYLNVYKHMSEIRFLRNICNVHWQTIDENLPNNDLSKIVFERNESYSKETKSTKSERIVRNRTFISLNEWEWKTLNVDSCEIYGFHLIKNIVSRIERTMNISR